MPTGSNETKAIFMQVLEQPTLALHSAYLDATCRDDPALRQRVVALLRAHDESDPLLDRPAAEHLDEEFALPLAQSESLECLGPSFKPGSLGRLGHYEVLEVAGRGGTGVVYRALDEKLQRIVAIKALAPPLAASPSSRQRFVREARAAAAVVHEHVVPIYAVEDAGPVPYLVMQYVDGPSLEEKLDLVGPLALKEILRIGLQLAEGLAAAHRQGLVHRDVKPANILLENGVERVKITDFGLARAGDDVSLTQAGVLTGTPLFMSPEQVQGEAVDCRSDLFSLGSVLYAMCTGHSPFRATNTLATLKRVCEETPRSVCEANSEMPRWLDDLIQRLLAKSPVDRFSSAQEVADLLATRLTELHHGISWPVAEPPSPAKSVNRPEPRRSRNGWVMIAAVSLLLFAGLGLTEATGVTHFQGTIIRFFTGEGTLVVEVDDPAVNVSLIGEDLVISGAGVREIRLRPGQYQVQAKKEGKLILQELVAVTKGGRQVVRVSREPATAEQQAAASAAWEKSVAALPAEEQVRAVTARLKEMNPDFDGKVTHAIADGVVTHLRFSTDQVTDISPVRALPRLHLLQASGTFPKHGRLKDLSPLRGMTLGDLDVSENPISDLSPLADLPLWRLFCNATRVSDLSPLQEMALRYLNVSDTRARSLDVLEGMPLVHLQAEVIAIADLAPLRGMALTHLGLYCTNVADIQPLAGMPLKYLNLHGTQVIDISPLATLRNLDFLVISRTEVRDFSALRGLPLTQVALDYQAERDRGLLESFQALTRINNLPAAEFWKQHAPSKQP